MKRLLLIVLPLLLIVGCSSPEPINYETTLIERDGVFYTKDTNKPYSGPVFSLNHKGQKKVEGTYKDGKRDGLWTKWYRSGQKKSERNYKEGLRDGLHTEWSRSGQKKFEGNYKEGRLHTEWYENGQKKFEGNYKEGRSDGLWTEWYENGQKKSEGNYKDGNRIDGLHTEWYESGQKMSEETVKEGESVSEKMWNEDGSVRERLPNPVLDLGID